MSGPRCESLPADIGNSRHRHSWSPPVRFTFKTERQCRYCPVVKVTRHDDPRRTRTEFWTSHGDGVPRRIDTTATPPCDRSLAGSVGVSGLAISPAGDIVPSWPISPAGDIGV